jgi:hypothetical protein
MAHEMAVLELADLGEYELAYATLRSCSGMLDRTLPTPTSGGGGRRRRRGGGGRSR